MEKKLSEPDRHLLSVLAHDLRTPLNNIVGFSNLVDDLTQDCENPAISKNIAIIRQEAEYATILINTLMEWSNNLQIDFSGEEKFQILDIIDSAKKDHETICMGI